jgi:hypothetical protein
MDASVPSGMTWKNSSTVEIKTLQSQPFKDKHFHFFIAVVFVTPPALLQ